MTTLQDRLRASPTSAIMCEAADALDALTDLGLRQSQTMREYSEHINTLRAENERWKGPAYGTTITANCPASRAHGASCGERHAPPYRERAMNDRTLLELAAKAADVPAFWSVDGTIQNRPMFVVEAGGKMGTMSYETEWNPLQDDALALRLAVKLRLSIDHNHPADQQRWVAADRNGCEGCYAPVSCIEDEFEEAERQAATRRAITRAAAAIAQQESQP